MTATQLASLIRSKTRTTSTTFSDADMLVYVNTYIDELAGRIQQIRPEIWNVPATFDLAADTREYGFPADVLNNIATLELKFSSSGDYIRAIPLKSVPADEVLQESLITGRYTNATPYYFVRRKAVYVLSGTIAAVTGGGKLVYNAFPASLANLSGVIDLSVDPSTTTHGFPREFHELLARRVSIEYKANNPGMELGATELTYDDDLENALDNFSTANLDLQETAEMPSGASMSDNGFEL